MIIRLRLDSKLALISFWAIYFFVFIVSYSSFGAVGPVGSYADLAKGANSIDNPFFRMRYFAGVASLLPLILISPRCLLRPPFNIFLACASLLGLFLFANTQSFLLGLSAPVATISAISLASSLQYLQQKNLNPILPFALLFALPSIVALMLGFHDFLYNSYYGRGRLLLGFVHPKETAGCLFFVYVVILTNLKTIASTKTLRLTQVHGLIASAIPFVFLTIGSRTTAVLAFGYAFALITPKIKPLYLRTSLLTMFIVFASIAVVIAVSTPLLYSYLNELSSNRLDLWASYLEGSAILGKSASGVASALDNSFLNIYYDSSFIGLALYLLFMLFIFMLLSRKDYVATILPANPRVSPSVLLLFILIAGVTDSGLTSPTSINFLSAWALLFSILLSSPTVSTQTGSHAT
jgi:hypothetical protein